MNKKIMQLTMYVCTDVCNICMILLYVRLFLHDMKKKMNEDQIAMNELGSP